jgi:hypothetical protein
MIVLMPELAFALDSGAAPALVDLAEALVAEISAQDAIASVVDVLPEARPDRVLVVFDELPRPETGAILAEPARAITVVTAPPGTECFEAAAALAIRSGASFHINSAAVPMLHRAGVPARHLQLGHSTHWPHRYCGREGLSVVTGAGYFDWVEALAAIHRDEVVLHERCLGMAPLVPGRDLFAAAPESLTLMAEILRERPERLAAVRESASAFVEGALPLALAAAALVGSARAVVAQPADALSVTHPAA